MPDHYFTGTPASAHDVRTLAYTYRGHHLTYETDAGTFSRDGVDEGSALLLSVLPENLAGRVLDLGCGWGAMGVCIAAANPQCEVTLTDINERAADLAGRNIRLNRLTNARAVCADGLAGAEGLFDLIALNPPIRAGKAVVYGLFAACRERLTPGGSLYIVIRKQQGAESALTYLQTLYTSAERTARKGGFWIIVCR